MKDSDTIKREDLAGVELLAGTPFSLGYLSEGRIMALAAASSPGSTDPVDRAVIHGLKAGYPQLAVPVVDPEDIDPATPSRRYSLTRIRNCPCEDGTAKNLVVMRGDLETIRKKVGTGYEKSSVIKRKSAIALKRGWRPLAVATAPVDDNETVGAFTLQGFVAIRTKDKTHAIEDDISSGPSTWARISVWSPSLRIQHWSNVAIIFILSCTGFFILDPFFEPTSYAGEPSGNLMAIMRLIHFTAAFLWLVVGATRVWSAFTSSDRYLRLSAMWPLWKKEDVRNLGRTLAHYTFIRSEAPVYLGHNPLQQLTYTAVYVVCGFQMLTGFALYGLYHQDNPFWAMLAAPTHLLGVTTLRLVHTLVMFFLWAFVIAHVYLVFRADSVERHGGLSAMVNGGVWVKRGTKPVDAPTVE